jgi:hypothetical protein
VTEVFLGIIALGVLTMATIQVAVIVWAARTAKRVEGAVSRLEQEVRPIVANLQALTAEAARATAVAAAQVDRADEVITGLRERIDETVHAVQASLLRPARDLMAMVQALRDVFFGGAGRPPAGDHRRRTPAEDEDALFIG